MAREKKTTLRHLILLCACAWLALPIPAQTAKGRLSRWADAADSLLLKPGELSLAPRCDDPFWTEELPTELRRSYIAEGERSLEGEWAVLPLSAFAEFRTNGHRTTYEQLCFERRRRIAVLALAELTEGRGRFAAALADGLEALMEEPWWGIPAHYGKKVPRREEQTVDLFNAETAALAAWTAYVLQPRLDSLYEGLTATIAAEVRRRLTEPARKGRYWWKTAGMNWNPWICSNWLACTLLCETDTARRADAVRQIMKATDAFIDSYPDDGGCDEGAAYWDRAAASMYEVLHLLREATGGAVDLSRDAKVRAMGSYVYKTYIQDNLCTTFADTHTTHASVQPSTLFPFGRFVGDRVMTRLASHAARQAHWSTRAGELFSQSHNFPSVGRELHLLSMWRELMEEEPQEPLLRDVWLPDLQIMAARRADAYVAVKGGHNDESHNHNDVGSFVVYETPRDGSTPTPILIDAAVGEYTAQTFSKDRYKIWTMQSQYHNLPQINGHDQLQGRQHRARTVAHREGSVTMELAEAYGEEAGVESWRRTVSLGRDGTCRVEERYSLSSRSGTTRLMMMTPLKPTLTEEGTIALGSHTLTYPKAQLSAEVEDVSTLMDPLLASLWGGQLYRIVLTLTAPGKAGRIAYKIK